MGPGIPPTDLGAKATFFACALALERNREVDPQLVRCGQEVSGHGYRWEEYHKMNLETELADPLFIGSFKHLRGSPYMPASFLTSPFV